MKPEFYMWQRDSKGNWRLFDRNIIRVDLSYGKKRPGVNSVTLVARRTRNYRAFKMEMNTVMCYW